MFKSFATNKLRIARNKTTATAIALFLVLTIAVTFVALPAANAHTPAWTIPTFAYISVMPDPVGVGQTVTVVVWLDKLPAGVSVGNDIRFKNYKVTITKPDKTTETISWPICVSPDSNTNAFYTPDQVGTYSFVFSFPGQVYTWSGDYQNDTYAASTSDTVYLTVQQEPIPAAIRSYPLPTEYWTRPIEGQNTDWWAISSHWLRAPQIVGHVQPDGLAPNSAHIMWTKPIQDGGVVGGSNVGVEGNTFYEGCAYNQRFSSPIIMYGRLFYAEPYGNSGGGGDYVCVDLRTGEELWRTNTTVVGVPSFGYYYDFDNPNQHGVIPEGLLFTTNFARAYDPSTGIPYALNITGVPSGTAVLGPAGEHLRYAIANIGNTTHPDWRLTQWNSSKVLGVVGTGFQSFTSTTPLNASLASRYDWNVTVPWLMTGATIVSAFRDDILLGRNGSLPSITAQAPYTMWAMSLKPESRGALLWMKNYNAPAGNITVVQGPVDTETRVFAVSYKETMQWVGYSLTDGSLLWGPTPSQIDFAYYKMTETLGWAVAYGKLYSSAYGGICYTYDMKNGSLLWTYGNGGPGNSTNSGFQTPYGRYPIFPAVVADGKIYLSTTEHSPNSPLIKGVRMRCVDAYTGKEIWTLMGYSGDSDFAVADGFLVFLNHYDMQIYCVGKGPSGTTVEAPMTAITAGSSVVIQGTVTDQSPGSKAKGTPAVSDASMGQWMEYVFMQKPRPSNATGVEVTLDAVDPNGNFVHLGTATSDTSGTFGYMWTTPDVPGKYTVIATFAGTESYWPSYAETYAAVSEAPPATPPPPAAAPQPPLDLYILYATIAIIATVAIATVLMLRKRA